MVTERGIPSRTAVSDMQLKAGAANINVIYSAKSVVLRLALDEKVFLMAPELAEVERKELLESGAELDADVAVLPNEIEEELLRRATPETVVLFVGKRPQDKPSDAMMKLLEGIAVLRTDERGSITSVVDADRITLDTQK